MKSGIELIAQERERQIEVEGYSNNHDRTWNDDNQLATAASYYCLPDEYRPNNRVGWPWAAGTFKPSPNDRIKELVKAGALIAAEIDRLKALQNELEVNHG